MSQQHQPTRPRSTSAAATNTPSCAFSRRVGTRPASPPAAGESRAGRVPHPRGATSSRGCAFSPRTCGRILALHRALGAAWPVHAMPHEPQAMPFAATRRHQSGRSISGTLKTIPLGTGKPVYVDHDPGKLQPGAAGQRHLPSANLTAYLIVLRAAMEAHGAPEALVSDSGSVFKAKQSHGSSTRHLASGTSEIDRRQPWQNYIETHFNVMRRMADDHYAQAATWSDVQATHARFFTDYNHQATPGSSR